MTSNKAWTVSVAASILLVVAVVASLFGTGFHFYVVQTPSMGTTAPVGTLVAVHAKSSYAIGDVVSYQRNDRVYTHRIVDHTSDGFILKGDSNEATDALPVAQDQIVGQVTFYGKYLGFLFEALPWIVIGCGIVYVLTLVPRIPKSWRWQIRFIGWSLVISAVALKLRPWVNLIMLGYAPSTSGGVDMGIVNTGIFPVSVMGTILQSGQQAVVHQGIADASGHYTVIPHIALNLGWFLLLLAICLAPMVASLLIPIDDGVSAETAAEPVASEKTKGYGIRRFGLVGLVVTASVVLVAVVLQWSTQAAFSASINNSADSVKTRTFFTCRAAVTNTTVPAYLAWALGTTGTTTETDLSTNGRTGKYAVTTTGITTPLGCPRDTVKVAVTFNGTSQCLYENRNYEANYMPNAFSLEAWFRTPNKSGAVIIGFGATRDSPVETNWDRHIYLDKDGRIVFGVYPGAVKIVYTSATAGINHDGNYADNQWHHVIATLSAAGEKLYVDGVLAMTDPTVTSAEQVAGFWKVGCGNLDNWRNAATDATGSTALDYTGPKYFTGQIQYAAVYPTALTAAQVLQHYQAGSA